MLKLRKKDRQLLESALVCLKRGQAYLRSDRTLLCIRQAHKTTTLHFSNDQGEICYAVDKEIGSELTLLHIGIERLEKLLAGEPEAAIG